MIDFLDTSIEDMNEEQLRALLKVQMARNELLVKQNKFTMYRYDIATDVMTILLVLPNGELKPGCFPNYFKQVPGVIFEETEHKRVVDNIKRIIEDPDAPKTGAVGFTYKDGRRISCEYTCVYDKNGKMVSVVGQHVDMYHTYQRMLNTIESFNDRKLVTDALLNSFDSMIAIDLSDYSFKIIRATQGVRAISGQVSNILELSSIYLEFYVDKEYQDMFRIFVNPTTVRERMVGKKSITCEYKSTNIGWSRARILPMHFDVDGKVKHVIFTVESREDANVTSVSSSSFVMMDTLTGLLNRITGVETINKALRIKHKSYFLLLDVDYFKAINSMLGHPVGDMVLIELAKVLNNIFPHDIVVRGENDEFLVYVTNPAILSMVEKMGVESCLEQLQQRVSHINVPELLGVVISMSAGIVCLSPDSKFSYEDIYTMALEQLNEARKSGGASARFIEV